MLQLKNIRKTYRTGSLTQRALDGIDLDLRENEFVAILGPSGSGKTTLLNVIGGLDRYDSGDLLIQGVSTEHYGSRDWDTYRNHTIGFVFQNYNLIPHQSVLSNVELALTIGGFSRRERRRRAKEALEAVGLAEHLHKKPAQLSGGQMQRVAIARALVGDPKILLADEPTGALDTDTGLQVMELLKEVARERLVVMVTHNAELAEQYASRIIRIRDGKVTDDSDPFVEKDGIRPPAKTGPKAKASMSRLTSLSLSFANLKTKLGRSLLTAFAGSIGIIGIALILSLSTGADQYIQDIQRDTMSAYPIVVEERTLDLSGWIEMAQTRQEGKNKAPDHGTEGVWSDNSWLEMRSGLSASITENNLTRFKAYLDDPASPIHDNLGQNGVVYGYDTAFNVYAYDEEGSFFNTDDLSLAKSGGFSYNGSFSPYGSASSDTSHSFFEELLPDPATALVSETLKERSQLLAGIWPSNYREVVLIVDEHNEISLRALYALGFLPVEEYEALSEKLEAGEAVERPQQSFSYESLLGREYYLVPACDLYEEADGGYRFIGDEPEGAKRAAEQGIKLTICGIIRREEQGASSLLSAPVGYTKALTDYLMDYTASHPLVLAQQAEPTVNIFTGLHFAAADSVQMEEDLRQYIGAMGITEKSMLYLMLIRGQELGPEEQAAQAMMGEAERAAMLDALLAQGLPKEQVEALYENLIPAASLDDNLKALGLVSPEAPSSISLYCDSFEAKEQIAEAIREYNQGAAEEDQITYTDYVGLLMSSVTSIIDVISVVLIAFVAVSLVVSSIMIGIITYISVLERTREIGVLRALGASKRNISQVFNAETLIIGLASGLLGIGIAQLILIPGNRLIHHLAGDVDVRAFIRPHHALILVALSTVLTLIGGFIPAKKAARKDPVAALRSE